VSAATLYAPRWVPLLAPLKARLLQPSHPALTACPVACPLSPILRPHGSPTTTLLTAVFFTSRVRCMQCSRRLCPCMVTGHRLPRSGWRIQKSRPGAPGGREGGERAAPAFSAIKCLLPTPSSG